MIYPIVKYGVAVLETKAAAVTEFDTPELHKLIEDMFESMYAAKGVGLAATQIGIGKRIAVIDCSAGERSEEKLVLINPEILKLEGAITSEEGCLSIPGFREQVTRAAKATAKACWDYRRLSGGGQMPARQGSHALSASCPPRRKKKAPLWRSGA